MANEVIKRAGWGSSGQGGGQGVARKLKRNSSRNADAKEQLSEAAMKRPDERDKKETESKPTSQRKRTRKELRESDSDEPDFWLFELLTKMMERNRNHPGGEKEEEEEGAHFIGGALDLSEFDSDLCVYVCGTQGVYV
ncbi:hypothetical protein ZHAS_00017699 [Anopheles sinensis]|uniref:Uncharacterized protein n=1 Tax=Anopheles sinensis TaxID=74873 RepID=A0A084WH03_ANOSI|nr:hypothetical protein ZHAS_00017699 [Anopheles sinensis]